ncbi:molybdopterin converting factor subunit 1 [Alkalibacillus aidingensis]|uniref:molybdopterin converting factor subunit 1 n=1 Tax=Alkalibacillus aidingensis TaxID=2747607 RepID=UPI001660451F|nr:molybdopterin converting factor subunit 1 [Alkalibacillus aidingensis]
MIKVLYFASIKDLTEKTEEEFHVEGITVRELYEQLKKNYGSLDQYGLRFAVNEEFVTEDEILKSGDIVALIPPVSGG